MTPGFDDPWAVPPEIDYAPGEMDVFEDHAREACFAGMVVVDPVEMLDA